MLQNLLSLCITVSHLQHPFDQSLPIPEPIINIIWPFRTRDPTSHPLIVLILGFYIQAIHNISSQNIIFSKKSLLPPSLDPSWNQASLASFSSVNQVSSSFCSLFRPFLFSSSSLSYLQDLNPIREYLVGVLNLLRSNSTLS